MSITAQATVYLKSGKEVDLGIAKVTDELISTVYEIICVDSAVIWNGHIVRSDSIEMFTITEVKNDTE